MALSSVDEGTGGMELVTITPGVNPQPGEVTLMAASLPRDSDGLGRRLMKSNRVRQLAGDHKLFLAGMPDGRKALCVGLFDSPDADGLKALKHRFRNFEMSGQRVFPDARPHRISP